MDRRYAWQDRKKGRVHLLDRRGMTLCQLEKSGATFPMTSTVHPLKKRLCANCAALEFVEPPLKVLMGEAML